jgi:hypothetical protein
MGLDMYAFTTAADVPPVDFEPPHEHTELHYWRKHPNLHGWMEALYRQKGGTNEAFNTVAVKLESADLDALEHAINGDALPHTEGFFFGVTDGSEKADDAAFIRKARDALSSGLAVFYWSWW